ncbi:fasciclin domain-containing protein [Chitinophaga sp. sic0106]|uniref:fasciclin domain-containing protein n=1 Tax=Chitinophaga sp. sic0106 TaxID=2854785 RepID=UPI001C437C15|nr:fasciclin domain-containing protein [Chitinophaga sp. sic0106]MBV7529196.1 fasciclin domain-containing protein [Chitinophaga sp. sic0106]
MMSYKTIAYTLLPFLCCAVLLQGCKKWEDSITVNDQALKENLMERIAAEPSTSKFAELVKKAGLDSVLTSSKVYTVFAPDNDAVSKLDAATQSDPAKLKAFVSNYITLQAWNSKTEDTAANYLQMLNGKYHLLHAALMGNATITSGNKPAKNGVYHVISSLLPLSDNIWETLTNDNTIPAVQKAFMLSLFRNVFDPTNAEQIGVDPNTGNPIYKPGTDSINTNLFWQRVYDLRDESKRYALFVMEDAAWQGATQTYYPYFATGGMDTTAQLASWEVLKDLAAEGNYTADNIPDTVLSRFNVKVPVEGAQIKRTITTSNGTIFIMGKVDISPKNKFQQWILQGEEYTSSTSNKRSNTYFRDRLTPAGIPFKDVLVYNHGTSGFSLGFRISNVHTMKYKAYVVAVNDWMTTNFTQRLSVDSATNTSMAYVTVTPNNYTEIYLGEFTISKYRSAMNIYLTAAGNTTATTNPLVCDYIRIEPSFN